jgi:Ala-tRNA(Pro) deacylase
MANPPAETELLSALDALGVAYTAYRHAPVMNVAEAREVEQACGLDNVAATRTKNLFLTDKKKLRRWLFTTSADAKVELKKLGPVLKAHDLKFASDLADVLGIQPGAVTAFGVLNDKGSPPRVTSVLDEAVLASELMLAHPMHNEATISVSPKGLAKFLAARGHEPTVVRFGEGGACELVSEPASAAAATGSPAPPATAASAAKGKAKPAAKEAPAAKSESAAVISARLEGMLIDDLLGAIKSGALAADGAQGSASGSASGPDEDLRTRLATLLKPHLNGLRNAAYVAGFSAPLQTVPKNPVFNQVCP